MAMEHRTVPWGHANILVATCHRGCIGHNIIEVVSEELQRIAGPKTNSACQVCVPPTPSSPLTLSVCRA